MKYCTVADVAAIAGEMTAAQAARAAQLIDAAQTHLEGEMGRAWLVGEQELEMHHAPDYLIHLVYWPVASVTGVFARSGIGNEYTELTEGEDWEIYDLKAGLVRLVQPGGYDLIRVTYVPVDDVPEDVRQACAELAANWLMPTMRPGTYGLDSYSLPDLSMKFARSHAQSAEPPFVERVIGRYRVPVAG